MRTSTIEIDGKNYLLCLSARSLDKLTERYGDLNIIDDMIGGNSLKDALFILSTMMDAGDRYAKQNSLPNPEPLSFETLYDTLGIDDLMTLKESITSTIINSNSREVETEPMQKLKNAEATQETSR